MNIVFSKKRVITTLFFGVLIVLISFYFGFLKTRENINRIGVLDHSKYLYTLELDSKNNISYLTGIPLLSGEITRFKLGKAIYNNLSLSNDKAFLSIYRTYDSLGLETSGKEIHVISLIDGGNRILQLSGYSPTDVLVLKNKVFVKVRGVGTNKKGSYSSSGFEVFDKITMNKLGNINLNESFPGIDWAYTKDENTLFLFAENVAALRSRSPYVPSSSKSNKYDYQVFFEIDVDSLNIMNGTLSDFRSVGAFVEYENKLILPAIHQKGESGLYIYSISRKQITNRYNEKHPVFMLKASLDRNEIYGVSRNNIVTIYNASTFQVKKELPFSGIRDMAIKDNKLFLIRRATLVNGYQEEPKITIVNLDTFQKEKDILGVFGPFAKVFN